VAEPSSVLEVDDVRHLLALFLLFGAFDCRRLRLLRWKRRDTEGRRVLNLIRVRRKQTNSTLNLQSGSISRYYTACRSLSLDDFRDSTLVRSQRSRI